MKPLIYILVFATAIASSQSAEFSTGREYVVANLKSLKETRPQQASWIKATSEKLIGLKAALPASDSAFGMVVQKGITALNEIQNQEDDTQVLDLFILASAFADYYRSQKDTPVFRQNNALVAAFKSFEYGEVDNPLAYFNATLRSMMFCYRHYYPLFGETQPQYSVACQIEYLGSAFDRSDSDGPDTEMVFAVAANWAGAFTKLKAIPVAARISSITTLEQALDSGEVGDSATEKIARQHLAEAKTFFGIAR
jgi:hypothetical protein